MPSSQTRPPPIRATYGERFRCIGAACEENCCQSWGISIDQATFERYGRMPEMAARIGVRIGVTEADAEASADAGAPKLHGLPAQPRPAILVRLEPTPTDHARIQLLPNGFCPFLDPDHLCGIQKQHGEELLPEVCASYPRAQRSVFGVTERALHLSCPEAARLVLLDPHLLDAALPFDREGADGARYAAFAVVEPAAADVGLAATEGHPHLSLQVRDLVLLVLTDRRYPLAQRLVLLGLFCSHLGRVQQQTTDRTDGSAADQTADQAAELLANYATLFATASLRPALDRIEARPDQQLATLFELLQLRLTGQAIQPRLLDCLQRFELGLQHPAAPAAEQLRRYTEAAALYYRPLMERHPYVLENYLANYVFKNRFPFGHGAPDQGIPGHGVEGHGVEGGVPGQVEAISVAARDGAAHARGENQADRTTTAAARTLPTAQLEHLSLAVHYSLIQGLLIGISAHHREEFALSHVCDLIQCVSKAIDHNASFLKMIERYVVARCLDTNEGIATLVC